MPPGRPSRRSVVRAGTGTRVLRLRDAIILVVGDAWARRREVGQGCRAWQAHRCRKEYSLSGTGAQTPARRFFLEPVGFPVLPGFFCRPYAAARRLGGNDLGDIQHRG